VRAAFGDFLGNFRPAGGTGALRSFWRHVRGTDRGLSRVSFPGLVGWKHYAIAVAVIALIGYINVRASRWSALSDSSGSFHSVPMWRCARSRQRSGTTIHCAGWCAACSAVPGFRGGAGAGCAVLRLEQMSSVCGRSRKIRSGVTARTRDRSFPLSIATYFLPTMFSLVRAGDWRNGIRIFFRCRVADRRALAGFAMTVAAMITIFRC